MNPHNAVAARLEWARQIAREAGQWTLQHFQRGELAVELKADSTPVTLADRGAEELLRARIAERFADDAILGEEFGQSAGGSGFRWIVDPIDGTKSFIHGVPLYGTLIGIEHGESSVAGVIYLPALDECAFAALAGGAWHQRGDQPPQPARVSRRGRLAECLLCTSDVATFDQVGRGTEFSRLLGAVKLLRTWGDCYGYLLVATGRADVMVDPQMSAWDAAALLPILVEAGGTFTDWRGNPTIHAGEGIATNGLVLSEVLAITAGR